jgi:hypothetical protein
LIAGMHFREILRALWPSEPPIFEGTLALEPTEDRLPLRVGNVSIHPFEIYLPVVLAPGDIDESELLPFPVKLDSGFEHNLAMSYKHLTDPSWAGQTLDDFSLVSDQPVTFKVGDGSRVNADLYDASLWIAPSDAQSQPFEIELDGGIAVFPQYHPDDVDEHGDYIGEASPRTPLGPRIPVLGCRALWTAGIRVEIDYRCGKFALYRSKNDPIQQD